MLVNNIEISLKKKKKKSINILVNYTEIFQKIKSKRKLSIENIILDWKK